MKKNVFYVGVILFLSIVMIIGFFLPFMIYEDINYTIAYTIFNFDGKSLLAFLVVFIAVFSFFTYKKTTEEEKVEDLNWPLMSIAGYMVYTALRFLITGFSLVGEHGQYTYTLSIAAFFVFFIAILFPAFYFTRVKVYNFFNEKILKK